ncbi:gephyrin-like molybdotransferase Glp [Laceyella putida]|uniref:Molybdopterin molybdenumtransferase n=1 Tax=Laceyella putida TaxID=110101 RepID=A0ABW2RM09_9BACL
MRFNREVVKVADARERLFPHIRVKPTEKLKLEQCVGRYLAQEIVSTSPLPHFHRSSMDGYAIRAADTRGATRERPVLLEVLETIPAGSVPQHPITRGTASRIMTGAAVPEGADAVVMIEWTETIEKDEKTYIYIPRELEPGTHIAPTGSELEQGTLLLGKGQRIGPGEMALLATFGYAEVEVYERPTVAIFATGSELLNVSSPLLPGKIRNSNSYTLLSLLLDAGAIPLMQETLPDEVEQAQAKILDALDRADLVITTGGVSVGDFDILVDIFERWDGRMLFNKVAMRPGSPTTVGVREDKFLFSLSGNPGACFVGFELFVRPVIAGMMGKPDRSLPTFTAVMDEDFTKPSPFERYVRGRYEIVDGQMFVRLAGTEKSSITLTIKDANCLIVVPPGGRGVGKGDKVQAIMLKKWE